MKKLMIAEEPDVELTEDQFLAIRAPMLVEAGQFRARVKHELAKDIAVAHHPKPTSHSSAPPSRKRRRVAGASLVSKGKQKEELDSKMDSEDERELLENPTTTVICTSSRFRPVSGCNTYMSYLGLMEHRQIDHEATTWHVRDVYAPKPGEHRHELDVEFASRLIAALGLGSDVTHSELDELLRSGRPKCSCGKDPVPNYESEPKWSILGRLVRMPIFDRVSSYSSLRE